MKNILLCTDFSPSSRKAVQDAIDMFSGHPELNYFLLSSYELPDVKGENLVAAHDSIRLNTKDFIQQEIDWLTQLPSFHSKSIIPIPYFGNTANAIHRAHDLHDIDIVVAGWEGKNADKGSQRIGRTTRSIIESSPCKKLIITSQKSSDGKNKKLLLLDEQKINDFEWWSTVAYPCEIGSCELFLVVISKGKTQPDLKQLPDNIAERLGGVATLAEKSPSEMKQRLWNIVSSEKPDLLNINVSSLEQINYLFQEQNTTVSSELPPSFFINSFG